MEGKQLLERYAELKNQINNLELELKSIQPTVLEFIESIDPDNKGIETEVGLFSRIRRKKWTYSPEVEELSAQLDEQMAEEKADGRATFEVSESVRYSPNK